MPVARRHARGGRPSQRGLTGAFIFTRVSIPFSRADFFEAFARYNDAIAPMQVVLLAIGVLAVVRGAAGAWRSAATLLAVLWIWSGVAYHFAFFSAVTPAAIVFGMLFLTGGALLLWWGWRETPAREPDALHLIAGLAVAAYALVLYPLIGFMSGQRYPAFPTLGAPCPTVILTFGVLLFFATSVPARLLIVPGFWAIVSTSAALQLGVPEDFGLPAAALLALAMYASVHRGRHVTQRA